MKKPAESGHLFVSIYASSESLGSDKYMIAVSSLYRW